MRPTSETTAKTEAAELRRRAQAARQEARDYGATVVQAQARLHAIERERMALIDEASRVSAQLQTAHARAGQRETEALGHERQAAALEAQG